MKRVNHQDIKEDVRKLYEAKRKFERVQEKYNAIKEECEKNISNHMFVNGCTDAEVLLDEGNEYYLSPLLLQAKKIVKRTVVYDPARMRQKLDKELCNEVIEKQYLVTDMDGLIKLLKTRGVSPKQFKECIEVKETVNKAKLNQAYELGSVKLDDVKKCCDIKESTPYIKLTEQRSGND